MVHQLLEEYNTNHKQDATKLLKLLNKYVLTTFENSNKYLIQFKIFEFSIKMAQYLIPFETKKIYLHSTRYNEHSDIVKSNSVYSM